ATYQPPVMAVPHRSLVMDKGPALKGAGPDDTKSVSGAVSGLRRGGSRRLERRLDELVEDLGILDGDLAEHLAVQVHTRKAQAVDELAVASVPHPARGVDTRDPQATEVALAVTTVAVGVAAGADDRFLGALEVAATGSVIPAGLAENAVAAAGAGCSNS